MVGVLRCVQNDMVGVLRCVQNDMWGAVGEAGLRRKGVGTRRFRDVVRWVARFFTPLRCVQNDMVGVLRCVQNDMWGLLEKLGYAARV